MPTTYSSGVAPRHGDEFAWSEAEVNALTLLDYAAPAEASTKAFTADEEAILMNGSGGFTNSGLFVGAETALRISAAFACRRVISEDIAKMPRRLVKVSRNADTGFVQTDVQWEHPIHRLLTEAPNDWMTCFEFFEYMVGVSTFHDGAYALVQRNTAGVIEELLPLMPGSVGVEVDTHWRVNYRVSGYGEYDLILDPRQIFRLNGPMSDPWRGHATISLAREAVGLAAAIEAAQARFHKNDMRPAGILTSEAPISPELRSKIRDQWADAYGSGGKGGLAILDNKFKYETIVAEAAKSEVLENRKLQVSEICRFFRVIPGMIGHNDGSQSFASIEAQFEAHKTHTLDPWVRRLEEAMTLCLLTEAERAQGLRVDIDMDALLRGTPNERMNYYEKAVKLGVMTPNEARMAEGRSPLPFPQMNMPQLQANNTGLAPAPATPAAAATPAGQTTPPLRLLGGA